jgi:hypothetical protein
MHKILEIVGQWKGNSSSKDLFRAAIDLPRFITLTNQIRSLLISPVCKAINFTRIFNSSKNLRMLLLRRKTTIKMTQLTRSKFSLAKVLKLMRVSRSMSLRESKAPNTTDNMIKVRGKY